MRGSLGLPGPSTPRSMRVGGRRAQLPVSEWGHSVSTVSVCPSLGLLFQAKGHACLGDPSPPNPQSVCLFAVCSRLGVLTPILTVNVNGPIHRVPPDTHPCVYSFYLPHPVSGRSPTAAAAVNARINTHVGLTQPGAPVLSGTQKLGSGFRQLSHPLPGSPIFCNLIDL